MDRLTSSVTFCVTSLATRRFYATKSDYPVSITCKSITFADLIATGKGLKVCSERAEGDSFNPHCFINGRNDVQVQTVPFLGGTDNEGDVFCKTLSFYFSLKEHGCSISKATQPTDKDPDADDGFDAKEFDDVLQHFRSDRRRHTLHAVCKGKFCLKQDRFRSHFIQYVLFVVFVIFVHVT